MKVTATANPVMTGVAVKFIQNAAGFVASRLFPTFPAGLQSAAYYVFDEKNMMDYPQNIQRAPGSPYARSLMTLSDDSYNCREYGIEEPVDDGERSKYASVYDADASATRRSTNIVMLNYEARVKAKATGAGVPTTTPGTKWDQANSDPIGDMDAAKSNILKNTGLPANLMVINWDVFRVLKEHVKITDKIKYTQRGIVTAELIAAVFGIDELVVAMSVQNTANEGQALSPAFIWGDSVVIAHVERTADLKAPNFGRTFSWNEEVGPGGIAVESYRQENIKSDVFRARQFSDEKLVGAKAGYWLSDTCAGF